MSRRENMMQKGTVISVMIGTSVITIIIGFYIGLIQKDIILLATTLVVIELFVSLIVEITGAFKDRLNKKEKELAKLLDIQKLKCKIYMRAV